MEVLASSSKYLDFFSWSSLKTGYSRLLSRASPSKSADTRELIIILA